MQEARRSNRTIRPLHTQIDTKNGGTHYRHMVGDHSLVEKFIRPKYGYWGMADDELGSYNINRQKKDALYVSKRGISSRFP
jgi:hypothetical protein